MKKEIPEDVAERILQQDVKNILNKVKAGQPLTPQQRKLIDEYKATPGASEKTPPKRTKQKTRMRDIIISEFAISERKAYSWMEKLKHLHNAAGWNVIGVLEEIARRKGATGHSPYEDLRREKLKEEIRYQKTKRLQLEGNLLETADVRRTANAMFAMMTAAVESFRIAETAKVRTAKDKRRIDGMAERFITAMRTAIEAWT